MTSANNNQRQARQTQHHQLGRLCQLDNIGDVTSSMDMARWFRQNEDGRCHRHTNSYSSFFQHSQPRQQDAAAALNHSWSAPIDGKTGLTSTPWSSLCPSGTSPWSAAGRPGCRGGEAWPATDNTAGNAVMLGGRHHHQNHQQQYPQSPDDVNLPSQLHKYPWMSVIGKCHCVIGHESQVAHGRHKTATIMTVSKRYKWLQYSSTAVRAASKRRHLRANE